MKFSVPPGFSFTAVDPAGSTGGYMLEKPDQQGRLDCSGRSEWETTSVLFTSASNIQGVSGSLHRASIDHDLSVEEDAASGSGAGCQYVTQHVVIPNLGIGMAISGDGMTATSALALAREIVSSATPAASTSPS